MTATTTNVEIMTPSGERVGLSSLWEARPAIMVFVRHFG